jgi:NAD(P)-dependent dehydrogenase (short-subunit alcohol dehydrogenase family)
MQKEEGRFAGKTVIVTGGAAGIGKSMSEAFFKAGANVVIADIKGGKAAAQEIDSSGAKVIGLDVDVTSDSAVETAVRQTIERFSGVDILVNNAGIATGIPPRPFTEIPTDEWLRVYDVNVLGIFRFCRAVAGHMAEAGGGRIVNIASAAAFKGVPFLLHYVSSKGAVLAMTKSLAKELGDRNILVNAVAPGFTLSPAVLSNEGQMTRSREISMQGRSLRRDQFPEDLVGAILFFASNDAAFITGQTLVVDGGTYLH